MKWMQITKQFKMIKANGKTTKLKIKARKVLRLSKLSIRFLG